MAEAILWFTQAKNMPFLQTPLLELFGETGFQSHAFDQVLKGMLEIPSTCNHMQEKTDGIADTHLCCPFPTPVLPGLSGKMEKSQETMASSPSHLHFGHYIMGMEHSLILELNATLAEIPLLTGNSPACWKHGLNVMLEKVQGTTMWKTMDYLTF